MRNSYY